MSRRLLIITDEMEVGGTQRQIVELARNIDRSAYDVSLVYFRNGSALVDELREAGVSVSCIPKTRRLDPVFFLRLCRYLREGDFDLVHGYSFAGELWGWLANIFSGQAPFIGSIRSVYEWYSPLQWTIKRWITLNSAALVANSQAGADFAALQMGVRRGSVQIVHNGMRFPEGLDNALAIRRQRCGDGFRVLFIGRLVNHKNVDCLVRAFRSVADSIPGACIDIVGDGPERARLEQFVQALGLEERVLFHGEQQDVLPFLLRADAFACCSHREGLSNAIMEAMSAGLPVIASNVGGNSELFVHEETGLLFPADDHDSMAEMLKELARNPEKREAMGESGLAHIRRFHDPRRMAGELEQIYERCLLQANACAVER